MSDKTIQIEHIMACSTLPVVALKSFETKTFIMGYYVYKSIWKPGADEQLHVAMQPTNALDKYVVAVISSITFY